MRLQTFWQNVIVTRTEGCNVAALQLTTNQLSMIAFYLWYIQLNLLEESVLCTRSRILRSRSLRELVDRIYLRCKCNFLYSRDVQKARYVIKLRFYRSKLSVVLTLFFYICLSTFYTFIDYIDRFYLLQKWKKKKRQMQYTCW